MSDYCNPDDIKSEYDLCGAECKSSDLCVPVDGGKPSESHICLATFSHDSGLIPHNENKKPYQCSATFILEDSLIKHKKIDSEICSATSNRADGLKRHSKIETGEKPYICGICWAGFKKASNLKKHSRIHSGEKPYTCKIC